MRSNYICFWNLTNCTITSFWFLIKAANYFTFLIGNFMTDGAQQQSHAQCFTRFDKRLLTDLSSHFNEIPLLIKYGPPSIFSQKQFIYGNNSPLYSVFISFILCERLIILTVFFILLYLWITGKSSQQFRERYSTF